MATTITADNGAVSGAAGLKVYNDGTGELQLKSGNGSVTGLKIDTTGDTTVYGATNSAQLSPNTGSYGPWKISGSKNGYNGLEFDATSNGNVSFIFNATSTVSGVNNNVSGWQYTWQNGSLYVGKGAYGGTTAVVWDAVNLDAPNKAGTSYYQVGARLQLTGSWGLYSTTNSAHFYPNDGQYGSWRIDGTLNGWAGIRFGDTEVNLMANSAESGFHRNGYGWQWRWYQGNIYCSKGNPGGGTSALVLDSSNSTLWLSTSRPGTYRLYRRDNDSDYSLQTYWSGSYWILNGYNGDTYHAGVQVAYSDVSGNSAALNGYNWDSSGKDLRGTEIYADNWFRNYGSGEGIYNQTTQVHWYSDDVYSMNLAPNNQGTMYIRLRSSYAGGIYGYYYADANGSGLLNNLGSWQVRCYHNTDGGQLYGTWTGYITSAGDGVSYPTGYTDGGGTIWTRLVLNNGAFIDFVDHV